MFSALRLPKVQLSLLLLVIYVSVIVVETISASHLLLLGLAVGSTIFFDLLFTFARRRKFFIPYAAIATGLIITLIIDPQASPLQIAVITALAMAAKNFLRITGRHVFNPAGIGLFIGGLLFQLPVSWWAVAFQSPLNLDLKSVFLFLILCLPLLVSAYKMRRFGTILVFLFSYSLLTLLFTSSFSLDSFVRTFFDPTVVFFAAVMLPEPMTSPVKLKRQVLYGFFVSVVTVILSLLTTTIFLPDILIPSLLLGNALFFRYR